MRFQIKQKVFSLADTYDITDGDGKTVYRVKGNLMSLGTNLDLLDLEGNQIAHVQQKVMSLSSEFYITKGGDVTATVKKQLSGFLKSRFTIEGPGIAFEMDGDWLNRNYKIMADGKVVAEIKKELSAVQETYAIDIVEGTDLPTLLCVAMILDED